MSEIALRPGWRTWRFEQIATNVAERVEPGESRAEHYVGLEHLDADSLKIRRWGVPSDVEGTKLRFRNGDIIFGRRRAYQRKLGVAEFDGICSAHAMVLRARIGVVLPEFLPFFLQSDLFMDRALKISVGSLSPTINWRTLAVQQFALPPLAEQRSMTKVLSAAGAENEDLREAQGKLAGCRRSYLESLFTATAGSLRRLDQVAEILSGGTPSRRRKDFWSGGIPWLSPKDMKSPILHDTLEHISSQAVESGARMVPPGTLFVVVRGMILAHTFPVCRSTVPMAFNQDLRAIVPSRDTLPTFLHAWLDWAAPRYLALVSQSTHGTKRLESDRLLSLPIPHLSLDKQQQTIAHLARLDTAAQAIAARREGLRALGRSVVDGSYRS